MTRYRVIIDVEADSADKARTYACDPVLLTGRATRIEIHNIYWWRTRRYIILITTVALFWAAVVTGLSCWWWRAT